MLMNNISTVIPIEISHRNNASAVREELLLRTDVDKVNDVVLWFGLRTSDRAGNLLAEENILGQEFKLSSQYVYITFLRDG